MPVIIPRQNRQVNAQVSNTGEERIAVQGRAVDARRLSIAPAGGPERLVWVDAQGRVLRLEVPATNFVAQRVELPK